MSDRNQTRNGNNCSIRKVMQMKHEIIKYTGNIGTQ